jgi:hypothetical protein
MRPDLSKVPAFYHGYINHVVQDDLQQAFTSGYNELFDVLSSIRADKYDFRYAENKWTIREVIQHLIDAERVFSYRAMAFARQDKTSLPGFDENDYANNSKASMRDWDDLVDELRHLRRSSEKMFLSFDDHQLNSVGTANNNNISVRAIAFIVIGHTLHHARILKERYL